MIMAAMCMSSAVKAGVWVTEPVLGLTADYSTNPGLLFVDHAAETHGAVLIDTPTTYHADALSLAILPSFRISDSSGYSSIASDYAHLTLQGEVDSDRDSVDLTARLARDSSLYYDYIFNGSSGVRSDTTLFDLAWTRALTERLNFNLETNSTRVVYGTSGTGVTLTDYRYWSSAPSLSWRASERTTLSANGSIGVYDSAGGLTKSASSELELGATRQMNELWSFSTMAGYSRQSNTIEEFYGPYLLGTYRSTNTGTVFTTKLVRQTEFLGLTATASRSLVPTGFSFLSLQSAYELHFHYQWTPRWTIDGGARSLRSTEPQVLGTTFDQSYWTYGLSAAWLFTEKWTLTLRGSKVSANYTSPPDWVAATGFTVQLSRSFAPIKWQ